MSEPDPDTEANELLAQRTPRTPVAAETVESYLARGGSITRCPAAEGEALMLHPATMRGTIADRWRVTMERRNAPKP